ncbi:hypothetical protein Q8W37_15455 [Shimia thalassica]|uniref:hypothetical protein n=1 Tax=Shimia thalassica TaxID=1715693 RepID=UPI0027333389|nr:hypothetical protein [Shimia thalassica]MDP2581334.1 hypothetical protein [Shimia thalassica]
MRGEFAGVKSEIIKDIFEPLMDEMTDEEFSDEELWGDLFREAIPAPAEPEEPTYLSFDDDGNLYLDADIEARDAYDATSAIYQDRLEAYNDAANRADLAWQYIVTFFEDANATERQIVKALEDAFDAIEDYGGGNLANAYYQIIEAFLEKYSLRYDLRRPAGGGGMTLHPTLPGMFARLIRDLKEVTSQDAALSALMRDFEDSVRDLKADQSPRKIKQSLAAQFNLLEALLTQSPQVVAYNEAAEAHNATASRRQQRRLVNTFGAMCDKADVWPHEDVLKSAKSIYGFGSDYPGIRHGGTPANAKREIDMRDMVSMTIVLAGFTPYFSEALEAERIYLD